MAGTCKKCRCQTTNTRAASPSGLCFNCQHGLVREAPPQTVACRWCLEQTRMTGTEQCDNCYEVWSRLELMPQWVVDAMLDARKRLRVL